MLNQNMTRENALRFIRITVFEFHRDVMIPLNSNIHLYDRKRNADAIRLHEQFHDFSAAVQDIYSTMSNTMGELGEFDNFKLSQLFSLCRDISELYSLPVFKYMPNSIPDNSPIRYVNPGATDILNYELEDNSLEKLKSQIRKFGDEELTKRLAEVENGQSQIVFEEMKDSTEGHTVFDNGKVTYRLNKKYEKASDEADLWKASIILAHELQRNPATGDLLGETAEVVMRDLGFIEKLVAEYGEKVYEKIPEFAVLHNVRKLCGEEGLKEFVDVAFNHEGSYYDPVLEYIDNLILRYLSIPGIALGNLINSTRNFVENIFKGQVSVDGQISIRVANSMLNFSLRFPSASSSHGLEKNLIPQNFISQLEAIIGSPIRTIFDGNMNLTGLEFHISVIEINKVLRVSGVLGSNFDLETGDATAILGGKISANYYLCKLLEGKITEDSFSAFIEENGLAWLVEGTSVTARLTLKVSTIGDHPTVQGGNFADNFRDEESRERFNKIWSNRF